MASGTLMLTLLVMAAGGAPDVWPINQSSFKIPIHVDPARRAAIRELRLFYSTDEGRTWKQTAVATPDQEAFPFSASTDGVYWFTVCAIDQQGNQDPADIYRIPPSQKILVDTIKPVVRITATERQGEDIVLNWEIQEEHPDLATLRLEYRTVDAPASVWYTQPLAEPALLGTTRFHLSVPGPISVRVQIQDLAGNLGMDSKEIAGSSPSTAAAAPAAHLSTTSAIPASNSSYTTPTSSAWGNNVPAQPVSTVKNDLRGAQEPARQALPTSNYPQGNGVPGPELANRLVASTENAANVSATPIAPAPGQGTAGSSNLQIVNSKEVTLDYQVDKLGPSGIGKVDLWITQDDGKTWRFFAEDSNLSTAVSADAKPEVRHLKVELPGEGVYGFAIVVQSKAGLGKRAPVSGDPPQMRLEVDLTPPVAQLYAPEPNPRQHNALMLTWSATDRNLASHPITLQYAEHKEGPWITIVKDHPNTPGRYSWLLPPDLPPRVFLRLLVQDAAGNSNVAETSEPVLVDLSEPEGKILGLSKKNDLRQ
jgi:hypothetical protein